MSPFLSYEVFIRRERKMMLKNFKCVLRLLARSIMEVTK